MKNNNFIRFEISNSILRNFLVMQIWKLRHLYLWQSDSQNLANLHNSTGGKNGQPGAKVVLVNFGDHRNNLDKRVSVLWVAYQTRLVGGKLARSIFDAKITGWILLHNCEDYLHFYSHNLIVTTFYIYFRATIINREHVSQIYHSLD